LRRDENERSSYWHDNKHLRRVKNSKVRCLLTQKYQLISTTTTTLDNNNINNNNPAYRFLRVFVFPSFLSRNSAKREWSLGCCCCCELPDHFFEVVVVVVETTFRCRPDWFFLATTMRTRTVDQHVVSKILHPQIYWKWIKPSFT